MSTYLPYGGSVVYVIYMAIMQDRFPFQQSVHLFLNHAPIIKGSITRINRLFADCYCNHVSQVIIIIISRVELLF